MTTYLLLIFLTFLSVWEYFVFIVFVLSLFHCLNYIYIYSTSRNIHTHTHHYGGHETFPLSPKDCPRLRTTYGKRGDLIMKNFVIVTPTHPQVLWPPWNWSIHTLKGRTWENVGISTLTYVRKTTYFEECFLTLVTFIKWLRPKWRSPRHSPNISPQCMGLEIVIP